MKITYAYARAYANSHGFTQVQIDGIPEGFSYKEPDITVGGVEHKGSYVAFLPLSDNQDFVREPSIERLITSYNDFNHGK